VIFDKNKNCEEEEVVKNQKYELRYICKQSGRI